MFFFVVRMYLKTLWVFFFLKLGVLTMITSYNRGYFIFFPPKWISMHDRIQIWNRKEWTCIFSAIFSESLTSSSIVPPLMLSNTPGTRNPSGGSGTVAVDCWELDEVASTRNSLPKDNNPKTEPDYSTCIFIRKSSC